VRLLDQTKLPAQTVYIDISTAQQMHDAIRRLVVRGAPAIGVAGAFGAYLAIRGLPDDESILPLLDEACRFLTTSRPTAVNLSWALQRVRRAAAAAPVGAIKPAVLDECTRLLDEDVRACHAIGQHGLELLKAIKRTNSPALQLLTHCNAGSLATVRYGTALAPIYLGSEQGLQFHVFVDETRPLLQGSRITAYELSQAGIPCTVLCDNMAASVMASRKLDAVIVGADRIAANGDVANKIGTLGVAILAKHFGVPFFVAAPLSTIDMSIPSGAQIPIEQRDTREVVHGFGALTAPADVQCLNPAFDVTPAELVSAIITDRGVVRPSLVTNLPKFMP
jgi:methylthioribose-1-phosphate isomerase